MTLPFRFAGRPFGFAFGKVVVDDWPSCSTVKQHGNQSKAIESVCFEAWHLARLHAGADVGATDSLRLGQTRHTANHRKLWL